MKLALGTVQFGLPYGINNSIGVPDHNSIRNILSVASDAGIDTLDTAREYGESEMRIGECSDMNFKIVTKLPGIEANSKYSDEWLFSKLNESLARLKQRSIYALLLHRPAQLLEDYGTNLYSGLQKLKDHGLVKKIGISIYDPSELDVLMNKFHFDIIQSPFNIFDTRLVSSGWLSRLYQGNVEIHVRSVFLQGLLLMKPHQRPHKFNKWENLWRLYDEWLALNQISELEACIRYACSFKEISKVIVGIESVNQLLKILEALQGKCPELPIQFQGLESELLSPVNWSRLK